MAQVTKTKALGEILVERKLCTDEQLAAAMTVQQQRARSGVFNRLGEILVEQGVMSADDIRSALADQNLTILVCEKCFTQFNVERFKPDRLYQCRRCRGLLVRPEHIRGLEVEDTVARGPSASDSDIETIGNNSGVRDAIATLGSYEVVGEISKGGMSAVYKARQPGLDRFVALKVLLGLDEADPEDIERFKKEARAVSRLRHPNIVGIHEVGEVDGIHFFTMDYIEGTPLDRAVVLEGLSPRDIAVVIRKLCDAVEYSHSRGVLHADIKPSNVLLDRHGDPVLIDFGIARDLMVSGEEDGLIGSPAYLAPEYLTGQSSYTIGCEVYSLGTCLYHLLSGKNPHDDVNTQAIIRRASSRTLRPLSNLATDVPASLNHITMTALKQDPARRYPTPAALAEDLRRFLEGEEILYVGPAWLKTWRRIRDRVALGVVLLISLVLVFSSGYYARRLSAERRSKNEATTSGTLLRENYARTLLQLAELQVGTGRWSEARETYATYLRQVERPSARARELGAQIRAQTKGGSDR